MSARTDLADALDAATPDTWQVDPYYRVPDALEVDTTRLVVFTTTWRRGAAIGLRQLEAVVWLIVPNVDPAVVDDVLDAQLDVLLDLLDKRSALTWTEAERGTLADAFAGYRITLTTQHRKA